jgi:Protein of unknown function (DUF1549)
MPFDEFAIDQVAGDLRPPNPLGPRIATGFHRNTPINQEGGIDVEQFRVEAVVDRVNTTGTAFLGLTIACCQCHDHKGSKDMHRTGICIVRPSQVVKRTRIAPPAASG